MDLKRKCNVKTFYFSIKTTIAIVSLLIVSWFYFSKPTFRFADIKYYECNSLVWRHFDESFSLVGGFDIYNSNYVNNYMKKYSSWNLSDQEVRKYILQGCNLARDDRRTLITIFSVLSATIFLSIPKPKASPEPKRVGSAPVGTGPDRSPSEPDPSRGGSDPGAVREEGASQGEGVQRADAATAESREDGANQTDGERRGSGRVSP